LRNCIRLTAFLCLTSFVCVAQSSDVHQLARDIFKQIIEMKTTESGVGSTPAVEAIADRMKQAGYTGNDLFVGGPEPRKQNIVVRLHGRDRAAKPILLLAHLDVVEANREDWSADIDPFKLTEKDGYYYGRGTQDVKEGASMLAANMIRWKQENWVPSRDIVLALTADEESGTANGVDWLLKDHRDLIDAEYCLNTDAGDFDEIKGKPFVVTISSAEKKYVAIKLETHNRGGHGSLPRPDNAIYEMGTALGRVAAYHFPVDFNDITREQLKGEAAIDSGQRAQDLKTIIANPNNTAVADRLSQDPRLNALMRTTCVATEIQGGHAENALPQHVKAVFNCRVLPQEDPQNVLAAIKNAVADPQVEVGWQTIDPHPYPPSPLNPKLLAVIEEVVHQNYPTVHVMPSMEMGASDGKFLRGANIPTYGVSGVFIEQDDVRAHGKDERLGIKEFDDSVTFYDKLMKTLLK
jgi:acetylornithine deacetylase/succinyl-diaminopimelate desuccinylase-like protein